MRDSYLAKKALFFSFFFPMNFWKCFSHRHSKSSRVGSLYINPKQYTEWKTWVFHSDSNSKHDSRDNGQQVLLIKLQQQDKSVKFELNAEKQHNTTQQGNNIFPSLPEPCNTALHALHLGFYAANIWANWQCHYWRDDRVWNIKDSKTSKY